LSLGQFQPLGGTVEDFSTSDRHLRPSTFPWFLENRQGADQLSAERSAVSAAPAQRVRLSTRLIVFRVWVSCRLNFRGFHTPTQESHPMLPIGVKRDATVGSLDRGVATQLVMR